MPGLRSLSRIAMRGHPVMVLDSAVLLYEPGLRRNDKIKVVNCQVNKGYAGQESPRQSKSPPHRDGFRVTLIDFGATCLPWLAQSLTPWAMIFY